MRAAEREVERLGFKLDRVIDFELPEEMGKRGGGVPRPRRRGAVGPCGRGAEDPSRAGLTASVSPLTSALHPPGWRNW